MARAVICKGDPTSHGGNVLEGNEDATIDGRPIAQRGHQTWCPQCKGKFPIKDGLDFHTFAGIGTAVEGMKTACGAILIATQRQMSIEDQSGTGSVANDVSAKSLDEPEGQETSAALSEWDANVLPGASSVIDGLNYAASGSAPQMLHTAQAGGHYYLPLMLGKMVGLPDERVSAIAAYSQFPDQVSALDGYTNGVRRLMSKQDYEPAQIGEYSERAIHALNGRTTGDNLAFYHNEIAIYKDDDARVGIAMHGLVDSIFHSRSINGVNVAYDAPLGHGLHGSDPDYISEDQARTVAGQLMSAFETVGGVKLSDAQRAQAMASVNAALYRARAVTNEEVEGFNRIEEMYGFGASDFPPKPNERMELNFRKVVKEMLGSEMKVLSPPEDLPTPLWRDKITHEGTLAETRLFIGGSEEEAHIFAKRGMQAAQDIMQDFSQTSAAFSKYKNVKIDQIYDSKVWSLRGVIPGYRTSTPSSSAKF
ncbi:PAAR domain-containing protein [Pseudoduganella violacea]|uniref:Putative Zn-binding protein involved in type VI secretion n=1 Tax=Pseudoduganella violacea TaxID=1715466 RepID=A0A7W5FSN9_9BURK|nr:PAAR domain-containing protein [Pseudoduganella violacea]MBB3117935.1 putative Zn-binding protein involved in type VI secretion [Pseudoduganella violacea]